MTSQAAALIKDAVDRILIAMREGRFERDELEVIAKLFDEAAAITRRTIERGPKNASPESTERDGRRVPDQDG